MSAHGELPLQPVRLIADLPPGEIAKLVQTALERLQQTDENLAKELAEALRAGAQDPDGLKRAVMAFIEAHPETLALF